MQAAKIGSLFNNSYPIPPIHHNCKNEGGVNCNLEIACKCHSAFNRQLTFSSFAKKEGWMPHHHLRSPPWHVPCKAMYVHIQILYKNRFTYFSDFFRLEMTSFWGWVFLGLVYVRCPERPWVVGGGEEASSLLILSSPHRRTLSLLVTHSLFLPLNNKAGSLTNSPTTEAFFCHHLISQRCDLNVRIHTGSRMASRVAVARLAALRRIASPALSSKRAIDTSFQSRYSLQGLAEQNWQ